MNKENRAQLLKKLRERIKKSSLEMALAKLNEQLKPLEETLKNCANLESLLKAFFQHKEMFNKESFGKVSGEVAAGLGQISVEWESKQNVSSKSPVEFPIKRALEEKNSELKIKAKNINKILVLLKKKELAKETDSLLLELEKLLISVPLEECHVTGINKSDLALQSIIAKAEKQGIEKRLLEFLEGAATQEGIRLEDVTEDLAKLLDQFGVKKNLVVRLSD